VREDALTHRSSKNSRAHPRTGCAVSPGARADSWLRCLRWINPAERAEFGGTAATWLATLTEDAPARF